VPAVLFLAILPWFLRIFLFLVPGGRGMNLPLFFDNSWFPAAPFLHFTAFSFYLSRRYPFYPYLEAMILGGFSVAVLEHSGIWPSSMPAPAKGTLSLAASAAVLVLVLLNFAGARKAGDERLSGGHRTRRSGNLFSSLIHYLVLSVFLALLLFGADRTRREQSIRTGGGLLASELFRFDFSDVLSLEPEITLNGELTMIYREDGPPTVRHLRRFTLSGWDEKRGFFRDPENETDFPDLEISGEKLPIPAVLPRGVHSWPEGDYLARYPVDQQYYLIALDPQSLFALNYPVEVEPWSIWDNASFTRAYAVRSMESVAGPWELMDAGTGSLPAAMIDRYLKGGDDPYYRTLAQEITAGLDSDWSRAAAVERWFLDNFYYSLRPGLAPDGDQLGWFLKETRRGYCSYFAFAMARICRAAGIPARVAVGFLTDPEFSTLGFVPVRSDQAHAWVEVWFDGYGWITFDPTSDTMAPGEEYPQEFISPDQWLSLIEEVLTRSGEISVVLGDDEEAEEEELSLWGRMRTLVRRRPSLVWTAAAALLLLFYLPGRILGAARHLRLSLSSSPRRRTLGSWRSFAAMLTRSGYGPEKDETPLDWALRIEPAGFEGLTRWTRYYLKAEYSPHFEESDGTGAEETARAVRRSARRMPLHRRLAGLSGSGWRRGFPW
jgi:transglutaminase-like putative cysteine protease